MGFYLLIIAGLIFVSIFFAFPLCSGYSKSKRELYEEAKYKDNLRKGIFKEDEEKLKQQYDVQKEQEVSV